MRAADRDAFDSYVLRKSSALMRMAYLLTGSHQEAEDLLQESLAQLVRSWHRVQEREATDAYVRRIMINQRTSTWRRKRVDAISVAEGQDFPNGDDETHQHAERDEMWLALATLPPRMRAVLVLRFYEDLTEAEVAATLGCSVGTVKSQSSRALAKLRDTLPVSKENSAC